MNKYSQFLAISRDILLLISEKRKRGEVNKAIGEEASTLYWYFNECETLFKSYQDDLHCMALEIAQLKMTNKMQERAVEHSIMDDIKRMNLEKGMESLFQKKPPTPKQWIDIIAKRKKENTPLEIILKHFELKEEQIKELLL